MDGKVESLVAEYATNKAEADRLTARNAEIADALLEHATFKPGSESGHLTASGFKVTLTRRINEKWDQAKLESVRAEMTDPLFFSIFKSKYEPDRRALKTFMTGQHDGSFRRMILEACTASAGKPSVKLEPAKEAA